MPYRDPQSPRAKAARARSWLRKSYGLTVEAYQWMLEQQGGACALCPADAQVVDHDHETGHVRGLLCRGCNLGLGGLGDNVAGLTRALQYVS